MSDAKTRQLFKNLVIKTVISKMLKL